MLPLRNVPSGDGWNSGLDWLVISDDAEGNYMGEKTLRELIPFPFVPSALLGDSK